MAAIGRERAGSFFIRSGSAAPGTDAALGSREWVICCHGELVGQVRQRSSSTLRV